MSTFATRHEISGQQQKAVLDKEIPLLGFAGDIAVMRDGSVAAGLVCYPTIPLLLSPDLLEARIQRVQTRLMTTGFRTPSIGGNLAIQVRYVQDNRIREVRDSLYASAVANPILRGFHQEIARNFEYDFSTWGLRFFRVLIFVRWAPPPDVVKELKARAASRARAELRNRGSKQSFVTRALDTALLSRPVLLMSEAELSLAAEEVRSAVQEIFSDMVSVRASPAFLTRDDILAEYYRIWNPVRWASGSRPRKYDPEKKIPPSAYFLESDFQCDPRGRLTPKGMFFLDGCYHAMLWLKLPPDPMRVIAWQQMAVFGVKRMEIIGQYRAGNVALRLHRVQEDLKVLEKNTKGDADNRHILQLKEEADALGAGTEKILNAVHLVHVWAETERELNQSVRLINDAANAENQMVLIQETIALKEAWFGSMPGIVGPFDEYRQVELNTRQASYMMPLFGMQSYLGQGRRAEVLFETASGSILNMIVKGPHVNNYNMLITGAPGSGKSFTVAQVLAQLARLDPQVIIVDLGDSYHRLVDLANGVSYEMALGDPSVCVNPFDGVLDADFDEEDILFLLKLIGTLVYDPNSKGLTVPEKENIRKALQQTINQARAEQRIPELTEYYAKLYELDTKLAGLLQRWTRASGSGYSKLLDGQTRLSLQGSWISFELGRVMKDELALMVMVQLIFAAVARMANALSKDKPKMLIFEEGGVVMKLQVFRDAFESSMRTMRKYGVSVVGIAQNFTDWAPVKPDGSRDTSIINQISHFISMKMSDDDCRAAQEAFGLSDTDRMLLQACDKTAGVRSDGFYLIRGESASEVHKIVIRPTPVSYAFSTNNPADRAEIERLRRDDGLSLVDAALRFSEIYPRGVEQAALKR